MMRRPGSTVRKEYWTTMLKTIILNHHRIFYSLRITIRKWLNRCFRRCHVNVTSRQTKTSTSTTDCRNSIFQPENWNLNNNTQLKCHHCTTCLFSTPVSSLAIYAKPPKWTMSSIICGSKMTSTPKETHSGTSLRLSTHQKKQRKSNWTS